MNKYEIYAHDENFSLTIEILAGSITRASELAKDAFIARYPNSKRGNIATSLTNNSINSKHVYEILDLIDKGGNINEES